ncbi:MAG TPA: 1-(5-phosphoribosyl)-5-[(5-phosphoribosylamino)methylideneamino]imidazole-4-carboxamide isomerase [Flavobacteriaceae bacterium]|nr:1-(5-phosphoribosyl)-5-[(5-phosphoribosylamino)methylideneamino]imidazole-4-carboxamide isomerase [Flavobacteriaceae bacterium]
MRIIPAIDIINGKCVRLTKGDYSTQKVYNENPLEVAKQFEDAGMQYLHLVDLDGAKAQHVVNYRVLEQIAAKTNLKIDFGGGIKSDEDLKIVFNSGARQITGGSIAVKNQTLFESWIATYGSQKIILGADVLDGCIAVSGWQESSSLKLLPFIKHYMLKGIKYVVCTDISKDGMLQGPSTELYNKLIKELKGIKLIASGGVSSIEDLYGLKKIGCEAAIIGKAIYEGKISLKQLEKFL